MFYLFLTISNLDFFMNNIPFFKLLALTRNSDLKEIVKKSIGEPDSDIDYFLDQKDADKILNELKRKRDEIRAMSIEEIFKNDLFVNKLKSQPDYKKNEPALLSELRQKYISCIIDAEMVFIDILSILNYKYD